MYEDEEEIEEVMEPEDTDSFAIKDITDGDEDTAAGRISTVVYEKFHRAKTKRLADEQRWLQAYRNYRGKYGPDTQFTESEKSRVFIKVTKTKVLAAYGQLIDVLFGGDKFPIGISPSPIPEGIEESVHFDVQPQQQKPEEDTSLKPGETYREFRDRVGPLENKLKPLEKDIKSGPGGQGQITLHPAEVAARKMEKQIHDQLEESNASKELRGTAFECVLLGTGLMKGPFVVDKEYPKWDPETGEYKPVIKTVPKVSSVSVWNAYPDPDATNMGDCEYFIERHKLARSAIRGLKRRPHFRPDAIDKAIEYGERYIQEWWENEIDDDQMSVEERFEVLEFWGFLDTDQVREYGVTIPSKFKDQEQVSVNVWICNGVVLRLVLNPYTPSYLPYYAVPYELNPYSFFGIGVAENMEDTQLLMNGFMRMAIDNAALSGNLLIEVDESALVPGQDLTVYPGKVFRRQAGAPGQAIFGTKYPNVSNENMQMFDKARQLADESTGMPSFAHGQTGVSGVGRTSSGISMLMSAANGAIRTVVKNLDDYLLMPMGEALFRFNMQFNFDKGIVGDLQVKARGTESLMANEVRSQRLMQFLSVVQNPILAPFAKMDYIIEEIAKSMDLDPEKVVNNMADAAIQARMMQQFQAQVEPQGQQGQTPGGPPPVSDTSGGANGNIGVGSAPVTNEQGFSGVPQATGQQQTPLG